MTMVSSGQISLVGTGTVGGLNQSVEVELGGTGSTQLGLTDSAPRTLAGVASGQISLYSFYGKSNTFSFTISANVSNANLRSLAVAAGWNEDSAVVATINSGIYVSSNSTGTPALTVNGTFPNGVSLINNGYIIGMGGNGGAGMYAPSSTSGSATNPNRGTAGGNALTASVAVSITNNGTIGGGGGGGGGSGWGSYSVDAYNSAGVGGGGGGGGRSSNAANTTGGAGGGVAAQYYIKYTGNAGTGGTVSAVGTGGAGRSTGSGGSFAGTTAAGDGGDWGATGATGGYGRAGAPGGYYQYGAPGSAGGSAVAGNSNITWTATGTRLGAIT